MSYLHTKFQDNWISSFRGVAMTRFRTDGQTDGRSDCTPRPAFTFSNAGKIKASMCNVLLLKTGKKIVSIYT